MNLQAKQNMSQNDLMILRSEMDKKEKSKGVMWLLWFFTGGIGGHRYYLGDIGYAIAMTFTLGGLGFWSLIDAFLISGRLRKKNEEIERDIIVNMGLGH
ncbi:TPA: TM2 domain-containing protein [Staphylococcus delphini]|uniref:TM2 domain-containing protein n=1 Tax=Staphylococcus delphini TaxID=53344 RepID=UPI0023B2C6EE|nr:TM2 domain-containing protein [Staphylococcus delphini]EKO1106507.1 TM2 domain-containing protein [Staphylococcus pseudintermedius]MDE9798933.1 TM2 domain-containing protein [Staphylococcus delphini]MDE9806094.1 TM2 domain-containing protein [Staphylococcus delphini]HEC2144744.1 TM2 domain-containing protein [Staphylococcus delphini]HEC2147737.1 TM2 domain-containing protein [Staphylococcus delphini]